MPFLLLILVLLLPTQQTDNSQMSLAERAAAATKKKDAGVQLTLEQRGAVVKGKYVNDVLQFEVTPPKGWEIYSEGHMNTSETLGKMYLNIHSAVHGSSHRVLGLGDGTGQNIYISIQPIPADAPEGQDVDKIVSTARKRVHQEIPSGRDAQETLLLGDASHKFAAFRYTYLVQGRPIVQSLQLTVINGFALSFTMTGHTDADLSSVVRLLLQNLTWKNSKP